jgi:hypothetical protein
MEGDLGLGVELGGGERGEVVARETFLWCVLEVDGRGLI